MNLWQLEVEVTWIYFVNFFKGTISNLAKKKKIAIKVQILQLPSQPLWRYLSNNGINRWRGICIHSFYTYLLGLHNSLGPSDAIWRQRSGSTLAEVMACCLTAPSHYLNQCWFIISTVEWHSSKAKFTRDKLAINHWNYLENQVPKISFKFPRGQWVNLEWNNRIITAVSVK